MKNIKEIKSCPICGDTPSVFQSASTVYVVWHSEIDFASHLGMGMVVGRTESDAIEKWNNMICKKFVGEDISR